MTVCSDLASSSFLSRIAPRFSTSQSSETLEAEVKKILSKIDFFVLHRGSYSMADKVQVIRRADNILASYQDKKSVPPLIRGLEKTLLAFRRKFPLGLEDSPSDRKKMEDALKRHDHKTYERWTKKYGLSEQIFFEHPKFVDFIFSAHLHKAFEYFGHSITMQEGKPGLMVEGMFVSSDEIEQHFTVENGYIYSTEEGGQKLRWTYVSDGLLCHDPKKWDVPVPIMKWKEKPNGYFFQVVTSHVSEENQSFIDGLLKGARHTWFRLICPDGRVYSFGQTIDPADFNILQPLSSVRAGVACPDSFETYAEKRLETTIPITREQAQAVVDTIIRCKNSESFEFNYVNSNCAAFTEQVMRAAGIADFPKPQMSISRVLYKVFVPKFLRRALKAIFSYTLGIVMPEIVKKGIRILFDFLATILIFPLGTVLGGWFTTRRKTTCACPFSTGDASPKTQRVKESAATETGGIVNAIEQAFIAHAKKQQWDVQANNLVRPFFRKVYNNFGDILNPSNLTVTMPTLMAKWQKRQGSQTQMR